MYMAIYMQGKSDQELYQDVSKLTISQITSKIQNNIGKVKKKRVENHQKLKDSDFFKNMMRKSKMIAEINTEST